jgi:hypothetical protein
MPVNPNNPVHMQRARRLVEFSRQDLQPFRENNVSHWREIAGSHWSSAGTPYDNPLPMLGMAFNIFHRSITPANPSYNIETVFPELYPLAWKLGGAVNHNLAAIGFDQAVSECTASALTSIGIMKQGVHDPEQVYGIDDDVRVSRMFAASVSIDNWVHDMSVSRWDHVTLMGDRYTIPLDIARERYPRIADKLSGVQQGQFNEGGGRKARSLSQSGMIDDDGLFDAAEFWDIYFPRERIIVVFAGEGGSLNAGAGLVADVIEYDGPARGPYEILGLEWIQENTMPLPPVAAWRDMHAIINSVWRKLAAQVDRQKSNMAVPVQNIDDGERFRDAADGQAIPYIGNSPPGEVRYGGPDQANFSFGLAARQIFSYIAGNMDQLGGLDTQAQTATQENLLAVGASANVRKMAGAVAKFLKRVGETHVSLMARDPLLFVQYSRKIPDTDISIPLTVTANEIRPYVNKMNFSIEPWEMQDLQPQQRLGLVQAFIASLDPNILAADGMRIDWRAYVDYFAHATGSEEAIGRLFRASRPRAYGDIPTTTGQQRISGPREEIRRSVPAPKGLAGREAVLSQIALGNAGKQTNGQAA